MRKEKKKKDELQERPQINLQLSEYRKHVLRKLMRWGEDSKESNKFWVLGEHSSVTLERLRGK